MVLDIYRKRLQYASKVKAEGTMEGTEIVAQISTPDRRIAALIDSDGSIHYVDTVLVSIGMGLKFWTRHPFTKQRFDIVKATKDGIEYIKSEIDSTEPEFLLRLPRLS